MRNSHPLPLLRSLVLLGALAAATGCIKSNLQVRVNSDGSGEILLSRMVARDIVTMYDRQLRAMREQDEMEIPADPFFNEKELSRLASRLGANVSLVKAQKLDHPAGRGYCALYAFKNVNDLCISPDRIMGEESLNVSRSMSDYEDELFTPGSNVSISDEEAKKSIQFQFTKGAPNKLRIIMPVMENDGDVSESREESDDGEKEEENPFTGKGQVYRSYGGMYGDMMPSEGAGMNMDISVEVAGAVVQTTASHPDAGVKNRIVLFSVDSKKLMSSPKFAGKNPANPRFGYQSPELFLNAAQGQPGFVRETKPEIEIQFQ